ncbi:hypothetical protein Q7P37_003126 [Cladosporium fusiforme]
MLHDLVPLKEPIGIRKEHICSTATTLRIRQKCSTWSGGNFTVIDQTQSPTTPKFTVDGKTGSWSQRRAVRDTTGLPIFDMRRKNTGDEWYVELPGGSPEPMITIVPTMWESSGSWETSGKYDIVVNLQNWAADGARVTLKVRGLDVYKKNTQVFLGDKLVMEAKLVNLASTYIPFLKDNQWDAHIAQGFDASLALAIVVVLAAHIYSM